MFHHILFATDGSPASRLAAEQCVHLAAEVGAQLTLIHVVHPLLLFTYEPVATEELRAGYRKNRDELARQALLPVEELARAAGVRFESLVVEAGEAYEAIINTARDRQCDLIAMASHGRKGIKAVLIGSQTQQVLTHSAVPVLVFR